jgi:hypothetical protein
VQRHNGQPHMAAALVLLLPACHQGVHARLRRAMEKVGMRGRFHKLRLAEAPPHPDPLPARGEREKKSAGICDRRAACRGGTFFPQAVPAFHWRAGGVWFAQPP